PEALALFELNLRMRLSRRSERRKAYSYWKAYKLPLKYRRYSLRALKIVVAIRALKERRKRDKFKGDDYDDYNDYED
ncbi:MAG: hypothetical protein U9N54_06665, partial [candidate division Zixibacteria bacterium]|nr:hypothetical protein [candidate division Zixibacteria bacterium]